MWLSARNTQSMRRSPYRGAARAHEPTIPCRDSGSPASGNVAAVSPLSRRAFLGVLGTVAGTVAVGCDESSTTSPTDTPDSSVPPAGTPRSESTGVDSADAGIVAAAVATHRGLQATYRGLTRVHPSTRPQVEVLVDQLAAHLSALGQPAAATDPPARTLRRRSRALTEVRDAEASAGSDRLADSLLAESGDLARVLASVAASHAQHVDVLDDLLRVDE